MFNSSPNADVSLQGVYNAQAHEAWHGQWIGLEEKNASTAANTWWCYRAQVELNSLPNAAQALIAADSKYWLWINGELAVFEGGLKRGPTPNDTWFDRIDLRKYLVKGINTFAVLLWHFGKDGFSHKNSGRAGLVLSARLGEQSFFSDPTWKVARHPAYEDTGEPLPNYRLPESNLRFDARCDSTGWQNPGYDDSGWASAVVFGKPPIPPWHQLIERPIPQWKNSGLLKYTDARVTQNKDGSTTHAGRLPYNAQVTPYFDIESPAGLTVQMRTDNYLDGSEPGLRAEYITKDGRQQHESLGWISGHEMRYTFPPGVKVHGLKYRETGYDTQMLGRFDCDDDKLNTLWEKSARTLYLNMRDTFFDCPGRERAQWWGDVVILMNQVFYACDKKAHALARKAILDLCAWQRPDRALFSPIPAGNYRDELPMQMLASVGRYGFWSYYQHTGDAELIDRIYPTVASYLNLWNLGDDGLVVQRPGDWTWGDWGDNKDLPLLYNGWYALALQGQRAMAKLTGRSQDIDAIDQSLATINRRFVEAYWQGNCLRSESHEGPPDDRGHALAVLAGLVGDEHHAPITQVLASQAYASPYMEKYVLEALYRMGRPDVAVARMKRRFAAMIDSPITTLWEGWELGSEKYGGGTYNHAWSGGPLILLSQFAAGIETVEPGFKSFRVRPQLGPLQHISARVPTNHGLIEVKICRHADRDELGLTVPPGSRCELYQPESDRVLISATANGQAIEIPVTNTINVYPGSWSFVFKYQ